MTIRKISGRTSSLAVKATVTQGGIFKAALVNPSSIKKLSNSTESLIPKIANVTARVIDHLLYDPDGFGVRHFYDSLLLNSGAARYLIKSAADNFSLADNILVNYVLGRNPADTQTTEDLIGFLLRSRRTFDDAAPALDLPSLGLRKPVADTQSFADFFFIARVKNFDDTLTGTDTFARLTRTARIFDDNVGMLDAFVFIDGSTFELRRRLSDTVSVNSTDVELLRNSGNETENFSYFIDKVLDPDMELLSQIAKLGLKTITDVDITSADRPFLYTARPVADTQNLTDVQPVFVNLKTLTDTQSVLDSLLRFDAAKLLADSTTMLDSMSFGDNLAYDSTKLIADVLDQSDRPYLWFAPRTTADAVTTTDTNRSRFTKATADSANLDETQIKFLGKRTNSLISLADIFNIARLRDFAETFGLSDAESFSLQKIFADSVIADDPLVRLSDGNISLIIKQTQDTQVINDYFARRVQFYRYPHHEDGGLGNFVLASEKDSKFVSLRARAGALSVYPIIRTNVIAWSEQFNTNQSGGYWTSIGATVISNQSPAPQNVVSSNSSTYDANQLQELFYNQPNNSYAENWYQLAPGRWVASSDGDLLIQDSSTGTHQLSTPNIPELIGTTNFGFAVYLKYAGHRYVRLWVTSFVNVDVDLVNNVVVQTSAAKASIQPVGGGWFLVEVENRIVNFGIAPEMQILNEIFYNSTNSPYGLTQYKLVPDNIISSARIVLLDSSLNTTFTGDGVSGVYVWGAQLEVGDQPEQEVSSLRYIRTAGGSASRVGFNVTPSDNDRVFVGRIQRRGGNERGTDANEIVSFLLQYRPSFSSNLATPVDYFARSVRYFRNGVLEPGLNDGFAIGNGNSQRRYSNDPLELISFWFNKDAKRAGTSTATRQTVVRQNLLKWSERFDYDYWTKTNVRATTGISVIGGSLPYRNVVYDADQIHGLFYNKKYTYNQGRRWWDVTPLVNKPDFTSNTIVDIFESSSNSIHTVQTFGFATNLSGDFFASSIYASPANGVTRFRLQVGSVFADFDLSSIAVLSSVGTLYNRIIQADTSTGWYLCTIIGPTQALGTLNFTGDAAVPTDLLQKLIPLRTAPDNFTAADQRVILFSNKTLADTTTMLSNFFIADGSTYTGNKQLLDSFVAGTLEGFRTSGNQAENVSFVNRLVARRSGTFTSLTIKLANDVRGNAARVAEDVFVNRTNRTWFQLAPYYSHSANILDYPTDYERVRVGSQTGGRRQSGNPYETTQLLFGRPVSGDFVRLGGTSPIRLQPSQSSSENTKFFIDKHIDETKLIPTYPRYDAAAVMGLFYNTTRNIDGSRYTPQDGNYTYYAKTDWYSLAPRYARPRFAWGTGNTPGTIMIDNMQLGDDLTYLSQFNLKTTVLIGSPDGVRGTSDIENFSYNLNMRPRRGAFTDLYIAKDRPTKFNANQTMEIFYGSSNSTTSYTKLNPYGRRWFQLAPYYASYNHYKNAPSEYDFVRVGSIQGPLKHQGWPTEIISLGILKTPYETSVTADVRTNWFNLTAKRSVPNSSYVVYTRKTNYIPYSESFNNNFWNRNSAYVSNPIEKMSGLIPYRNIKLDADQVAQIFYATSNNVSANNYYNNYYQTQWYNLAPLNRRKTFIANIQDVLYDSPGAPDRHFIQSNVNFAATETNDQYFSMSVYVSSSTANFRLDVGKFGQVYCDFNLSSGTVITSVGTLYNRIRLIDSATGVYLCQIVGPITTNNSSNIIYNTSSVIRIRLNDTQTFSDYLKPASRTFRTLSDSSTSIDFLTNFYGSDLMEPTAALLPLIDAASGTGSEDYLISP